MKRTVVFKEYEKVFGEFIRSFSQDIDGNTPAELLEAAEKRALVEGEMRRTRVKVFQIMVPFSPHEFLSR